MKRYALLKLWPVGCGSANLVLAETPPLATLAEAIVALVKQLDIPIELDEHGYAKYGLVTYTVAEFYNA
jgi:hypothetical protein